MSVRLRAVRILLSICAAAAGCAAYAGPAAPPAGPILFFDSFEKPFRSWNAGQYATEMATTKEGTSRKLTVTSWDKKQVWAQLKVNEMGLGLIGRFQTNAVFAGVKIYGSDLKDVRISFSGYAYVNDDVKDNQWNAVFCNVSQTTKDKKRPPADIAINDVAIVVTSKSGNTPTVYIDDFILTAGVAPLAAWPAAIAADNEKLQRLATPFRHGFHFSDDYEHDLKEALKDAGKHQKIKTILAIGFGKNGAQFSEAVKAAAPAFKVSGAAPPQEITFTSFQDLRIFLPYMLSKTDSETVVLAPTVKQVLTISVNEAVIMSQRCLSQGAVPLWVLPAPPAAYKDDEKKKLNEVSARWTQELAKYGVPTIYAGFGAKDVAKHMDGEELSAAGNEAVAKVVLNAVTHVDRFVRGRK